MDADELIEMLLDDYDGVVQTESWGERGLFYNPKDTLSRGVYFVTVKERDGENDVASDLDRDGVYRVNLGISEETYQSLFGEPPDRPAKGEHVATGHDFTVLDEISPHPTYAWMRWVAVLNPSDETVERMRPLFDEAYDRAQDKFTERTG